MYLSAYAYFSQMNQEVIKIEVDLDAYAIYKHELSNTLLAIDLQQVKRMDALVANFGEFSNVPDSELITAIDLVVKDTTKGYELTSVERDWKVKEIFPLWIDLGRVP